MDLRRLPGPAQLIDTAVDRTRDGSSVLIQVDRETPRDLAFALNDAFHAENLSPHQCCAVDPSALLAERSAAAAIKPRTPGEFEDLGQGVLVVTPPCFAGWPAWRGFVREFCAAARASDLPLFRRPRLCLLLSDALDAAEAGLAVLSWSQSVREGDIVTLIDACDEPDTAVPVFRSLRRMLIAERGGRNLESIERLGRRSLFELLAASERLDCRQVWRAQVRVLFPWLEAVRSAVVESARSRLRLPWRVGEELIADADSLELRDIRAQARVVLRDQRLAEDLDRLVRLRNRLAHGQPVTYSDLVALPQRWLVVCG